MKNRCKICQNDAGDYRICEACYRENFAPCASCLLPTPQITKFGKTAIKNCRACAAKASAPLRTIGKKCLVCKIRFQSAKAANVKRVCDNCMEINTHCPHCTKPMPMYKEKGGERKYCSFGCSFASVPKDVRAAFSVRANATKRKAKPPTTHQNKLARVSDAYKQWRKVVYERDGYTCQNCGACNQKGNGKSIQIHPHHIKPFASFPELRFDPANGITLCVACHRKEHKHVFIGKTKAHSVSKS